MENIILDYADLGHTIGVQSGLTDTTNTQDHVITSTAESGQKEQMDRVVQRELAQKSSATLICEREDPSQIQ